MKLLNGLQIALIITTTLNASDGFAFFGYPPWQLQSTNSNQRLYMNFFQKVFEDAFKNEDLAKPQNAGLKNGPKKNDEITIDGQLVEGAIVGQKVRIVASKARVRINYGCGTGECGACAIKMNGEDARACNAIIPTGRCEIETQ
mmetsp:Transcript_65838/g.77359  ORF Transcript_65838/g.77359 Transcript_65838/m.77359 type:complete len:144 (+) Transcript_65838:69-500(+)